MLLPISSRQKKRRCLVEDRTGQQEEEQGLWLDVASDAGVVVFRCCIVGSSPAGSKSRERRMPDRPRLSLVRECPPIEELVSSASRPGAETASRSHT